MISYPKKLLEPILKYLKSEERELKKRQEEIASEDPYSDEDRSNGNMSDFAESGVEFGHLRSQAMGDETRSALMRVQNAMKRVQSGEYGVCVKCGGMIDTDRLGIDPTVELCISCAKSGK